MERVNRIKKFVCFIDIMGFKERVFNSQAATLYRELSSFHNEVSEIISRIHNNSNQRVSNNEGFSIMSDKRKKREKDIMFAQFSDSIVLISSDDTQLSLKNITNATKNIFLSAMKMKNPLPLRGALSLGTAVYDTAKQLFFGQAIIDAYLLEENVQYYGVVVHHTAEGKVKQLGDSYHDADVFLKSGRIRHYELQWYREYRDLVENYMEKVRLSVSDNPRRYIDNTLKIISETYKENGNDNLDG